MSPAQKPRDCILIVDDNPEDIETYKRYLRHNREGNLKFWEAETGEQGLAMVKKVQPDCVLFDYRLPDIDGLDFLSELTQQEQPPAAIMLTGQSSEKIAVKALKNGAYDYLNKNEITPTVLQISVSNALEKVKLVAKINKKQIELQQRNKELQEFATVISHDLKEPLRKIINFTELLTEKMDNDLDEDAKRYFHYITDGAQRMQCMISDLLIYSQMGIRELPFEEVDLAKIANEIISDISHTTEDTQSRIEVDSLPTVKANATLMRQLFQNLLTNAIKYLGETPPVIKISVQKKPGKWLFVIKDNGIGIDPQFHERIFKIFQRLHTREEYPGTGVGLAICSKIIKIHGGRIWVESETGKGSAFYFTLPHKKLSTRKRDVS